jgi:putative phosphoribosyl transferase
MSGFVDRMDAGRRLAQRLARYTGTDAHVLGMARGGVVIGYAIADSLNLPLHALVVRKVGAPQNPELALGAVSETGAEWLDRGLILATGASEEYLQREIANQVAEARRRRQEYAIGAGPGSVEGHTAIVADDGIATGSSALVGVRSARSLGASHVVLATAVASRPAESLLQPEVDEMVVLDTPEPFYAVGLYYGNFDQVSDDQVIDYLRRAQRREEER